MVSFDNQAEIAARLIAAGMPVDLPVLAVAHATTPREARMLSDLTHIGADLARAPMEAPVLFMIGRVAGLYATAALPLPRELKAAHLRVVGNG